MQLSSHGGISSQEGQKRSTNYMIKLKGHVGEVLQDFSLAAMKPKNAFSG